MNITQITIRYLHDIYIVMLLYSLGLLHLQGMEMIFSMLFKMFTLKDPNYGNIWKIWSKIFLKNGLCGACGV